MVYNNTFPFQCQVLTIYVIKIEIKWENSYWEGVFLIKVNGTSFDDFINQYGYYCENNKKRLIEIKSTENLYVLYSLYNAPQDSIWNDDLMAH